MTFFFILTVAALAVKSFIDSKRNRVLMEQIAALADAQAVTDSRLDKLSRKSKKQTCKAAQHEAKIARLHRKQAEQKARQDRIEKEQRKQAVTISRLTFKLNQAVTELEHQQTRLSQLFALLDVATLNQAGAVPGTAQDVKYQKQIIALENQIAACEKRIAKAEFDRLQAQEALAA